MKKLAYNLLMLGALLGDAGATAQTPGATWAEKMAGGVMNMWKDGTGADDTKPAHWTYDQGVVLKGMEALWSQTGDAKYFTYIQHSMDKLIGKDGSIASYKLEDYNID
ncbi:MAG: glycoside hydrolase family 88 protein, partial [Bacteroidetes bacterium]|nr:glycoside hydrolase family 88 protein [Bacteroidota bacterium]